MNVLLAAVLIRNELATPPQIPDSMPGVQGPGAFSLDAPSSVPQSPSTDLAGKHGVISTFRWSQVESQDYKEYLARLRAVGVPERTIRDLIIGDVYRLYRPKLAAARGPKKTTNDNFWEKVNPFFGPNQNLTSQQRAQINALQKEQNELIKTLLGKDVYQAIARDAGSPDWTERTFGPIPSEKLDLVREMQERFQDARTEAYAKSDGMPDQEMQAEVRSLERQFRHDLATVLTPEQLTEYEVRSSDTANNLRFHLGAFEPNEQEFRAIFQYKQALEDLSSPFQPDDSRQRQNAAEQAMNETLGPERLKEYQLLQESAFKNLASAGASRESILKVAETKSQAQEAAGQIRQDKSLTPEQRAQALLSLRTTTETTLAELLGERRSRAYSRSADSWLQSLAPTAKPQPTP